MKRRPDYGLLAIVFLFVTTPCFAVSKQIIQLQTQVQELQDQMTLMQQSFSETVSIMQNLVKQQTDTINRVDGGIQNLKSAYARQQAEVGQRDQQISGQIQAISDFVAETKAKLAKVSATLDQLANQEENVSQTAATQAPPPDVLYDNASSDYDAGKLDLASQEFAEYLQDYPVAAHDGEAQFYLAEIEYAQGNFTAAIRDYDKVLNLYPGGSKMAGAELKKGLALIQLGEQEAAAAQFKTLIQSYPASVEADRARKELPMLKVTTSKESALQ